MLTLRVPPLHARGTMRDTLAGLSFILLPWKLPLLDAIGRCPSILFNRMISIIIIAMWKMSTTSFLRTICSFVGIVTVGTSPTSPSSTTSSPTPSMAGIDSTRICRSSVSSFAVKQHPGTRLFNSFRHEGIKQTRRWDSVSN